MFNYLIIFTVALLCGIIFILWLTKLSSKYNLLKTKNIPLVGGLAAGLAFFIACGIGLMIFDLAPAKLLAVGGAGYLMLIFGVIDDLKELSVWQKFLLQSVCAVVLIAFGVKTDIMYFGPGGNALITFFWLVGMTNAFNLLDIMDGLAAGTILIVSSAFFIIGIFGADLTVQMISLVLCAISLGFLLFNFPPARVYLGNSGSHFFGLLIASLALMTHYASEQNVFALFSPVMILGLPIMDTVLLVIFRMMKKKIPFIKSRDHLALKIGALGVSPRITVAIMYSLCLFFSACGVILVKVNNLAAGMITISVFLCSIIVFMKLVKIKVHG